MAFNLSPDEIEDGAALAPLLPPIPAHWRLRLRPSSFGATLRFGVSTGKGGREISVYFDAFDKLGSVGEPYWEIYPDRRGEAARFLADEVEEMFGAINASLRKWNL
jgi:hypothetical protein